MRLLTNMYTISPILALSSLCLSALATSIPYRRSDSAHQIFTRAESNCNKVDSRLPDDFKCTSQDAKCISIDDGSSAICCTDDQDCKSIRTIACDIQKQNVTAFPDSAIFTTSLSKTLSTCGSDCCPFGYDCITQADGDSFCSMLISQSSLSGSKAQSSSSSTSTSASATSTSKSTATSTSAAATGTTLSSSIDSTNSQRKAENPFPPGVFLAGLFPGMVVGALLLLAWVIYSGRHKKPGSESRPGSQASHRPIISEPIPMTGGARSDFTRRFQARLSKAKSTLTNSDSRTDSNPWKNPTPPVPNNIPEQYVSPPITPYNKTARDSGLESIRIYSPPSMVQHPSATVPPLRNMSAQRDHRRTVDSLGSPFPPSKANGAYEYNAPAAGPAEGPVLGSQRYEAQPSQPSKTARSKFREENYGQSEESKRDTSFTALMQHCNIPDRGDEFPVPKIPKPYETRL